MLRAGAPRLRGFLNTPHTFCVLPGVSPYPSNRQRLGLYRTYVPSFAYTPFGRGISNSYAWLAANGDSPLLSALGGTLLIVHKPTYFWGGEIFSITHTYSYVSCGIRFYDNTYMYDEDGTYHTLAGGFDSTDIGANPNEACVLAIARIPNTETRTYWRTTHGDRGFNLLSAATAWFGHNSSLTKDGTDVIGANGDYSGNSALPNGTLVMACYAPNVIATDAQLMSLRDDPFQILALDDPLDALIAQAAAGGSTYNESVSGDATSAEALAQNAVLAGGLSDAATAAEALTQQAVVANAHTETVTADAAQTSALIAVNAVLEVASASEALTSALTALAAISDAASATDAATGSLDQLIRPSSDTHTGDWITSSGSGTSASHIDEAAYSDSDYIYTETPSAYCEVALQAATDPSVSTGHTLRYRARAPYDGSVKVGLYQSTTLIAEWTDVLTASFAEYSHTLAGAEADAITDYAALRLRFTALS